MKRIGILTAGGDTPALNATVHGAVTRANQLQIEVTGLIKGFNFVNNDRVPHVNLNPLYQVIPELDPTRGGTIIGASRDYVDPNDSQAVELAVSRLNQLGLEGLICVGGDGTLNGLQPIAEKFPVVLAPKTIDNDLGLNYRSEPDEWLRNDLDVDGNGKEDGMPVYTRRESRVRFSLDQMINYVTPGYATAVYVSAGSVGRIRTTAESHRRIAVIEVMGRHSGFLALGTSYGKPDILLVPEHPLNPDLLIERVKEIYEIQKNVVIVCGEGIVGEDGEELGAAKKSTDPAGNLQLSGAAEAVRSRLIEGLGDDYFKRFRRGLTARDAVFTRKVGHTQRGGRPIHFDRFHAAQLGGKAVDMLLEGQNNATAILQWDKDAGFKVDSYDANCFRDAWGLIHARAMHPSFYDSEVMKPSMTGIDYLLPIFSHAISDDDIQHFRNSLFSSGNLKEPYHSPNTDLRKRIRTLKH